MNKFKAKIEIIGINPFVFLPAKILKIIFTAAAKDRGAIPIRGTINDKPYKQTLVKYQGMWRFYINTTMLKNSPKRIGEMIVISIGFDPQTRVTHMHPKLREALKKNETANLVFEKLSPSSQKEIMRYINNLKMEASIDKNVARAINFLLGKERFIGRDKP